MTSPLTLTGFDLTLKDVAYVEDKRPKIQLADEAIARMQASVAAVARISGGQKSAYGINTGFGALANQSIPAEKLADLQYNLVRSHACGVGKPLKSHLVRRLMLLKANSLAMGHSGIRPEVVQLLLDILNAGIVPHIPGKGSVGASGDLAPLAHLALVLIGEGQAYIDGELMDGKAALAQKNLQPINLQAKEGLAFLNGTQLSAALCMQGLFDAQQALFSAILAGALSVEGLAGSYTPFDARISKVRNMTGQQRVAALFRGVLTESEIHQSHADCNRVQDPYAVRCMPQVYGGIYDTIAHAATVLAQECNSVTDNPLIFEDEVLSGGNFHAQPLAFLSDFLAIAVSEIGSMSERRIDILMRKVNPNLNMFLAEEPGLESGFMIAHVTAAALASENKTLCHPASVDNIPTSAGQEDHVSMAPWAGHKLLKVTRNVRRILGIELLAALDALDEQGMDTKPELENVRELLRGKVPFAPGDRVMDRDIETLTEIIRTDALIPLLPKWDEAAPVKYPRLSY